MNLSPIRTALMGALLSFGLLAAPGMAQETDSGEDETVVPRSEARSIPISSCSGRSSTASAPNMSTCPTSAN